MSKQNPWDDYTITPAQLELKTFLDKYFTVTYEFSLYCVLCTIRLDLYLCSFRFGLTEKDDEECEELLESCKEYLQEKKHKQKATALAGT